MAGHFIQLVSFICLSAIGCTAISVNKFIPFGTDKEDTIFFSNDDNTTSISVPVRFPFYDRLFTTIHINNNGLLSFEAPVKDYTPRDFPLKANNSVRGVGVAFIAPFWADVDTREDHGTVFFRSTTDQSTLNLIKDVVSNSKAGFQFSIQFKPKWALVATWEEVGYYDRHGDMQNNTFQVVVVTDGLFSFTIFNYAKLTWVTGDASLGTDGFGGTPAMVGINAGDGVNFERFKHSLTDNVIEVLNDTNMRDCMDQNLKGQYVYQIDTVSVFDNQNCDDSQGSSPTVLVIDLCTPETISLSPSFGAVHTGGFVVIAGPPTSLYNLAKTARIVFGDGGQELDCHYQSAKATAICPVPLFHPESAGKLNVTFTVTYASVFASGVCTFRGQYRVDPPQPFMEGALMMTEEDDSDCGQPMSKPVLNIGERFCLTWNAKEHFALDQVSPFQADNIEVNVTMHYLSTNTTLPNDGEESGWKIFDLDREFLVEPFKDTSTIDFRPLLNDEAAVVALEVDVNPMEVSRPVPILIFFKVSIIGAGINMFTSSPLVSLVPKPSGALMSMTAIQCDNIIPKLDKALVNRMPCPATMRQAFLDPSLVVDSGCIVDPSNPNAAFNCHLNPGAMQCFLQRDINNASQIVGQCCYNSNDILFTKVNGGGLDRKEDPGKRYFEHFSKDLWPIIVCCEELEIADANCVKILNDRQEFFKSSIATGYSAPQVGMLFGDPHFRTFDGKAYTFNGLGEYILVDAMDGDFVIQIRTAVASNGDLMGTSISAVTARLLLGDPVQLEFNERFGVTVYVNGTRVSFLDEEEQDFGSFAVVHQLNGTANVTFTNGVVLSVTGSNEILNIILTVPNTFKNHTKGLLGTWNDNPDDDFLTPSGTMLPANSTEEELFREFGQKWMASSDNSLFFYRPGESSNTINQPSFEPTFGMPDLTNLNATFREMVEQQCGDQQECIYDAVVTANIEIGVSTMSSSNEFVQRQAEALPPVCNPECQNGGECVLNDTCSCPSEFTGPICADVFFKRTDDKLTQSTVLTAPMLLDEEVQDEFGSDNISLCYQVHGRPEEFFSLISDVCVSVNVHYQRQTASPAETYISEVGIIGVDDNDTCVRVAVNSNGCEVTVNNEIVQTSYEENGLAVTKLTDGVRLSLPNCEFREVIITVMCSPLPTTGQSRLELFLSRMLNFRATSHGLLGQFWNVPVMLEKNPIDLEFGGFLLPTYNVTIQSGGAATRSFTARLFDTTWDAEDKPCLYAGDGQAGPDVLEGSYLDYQVADTFDTNFRFSKFRAGFC